MLLPNSSIWQYMQTPICALYTTYIGSNHIHSSVVLAFSILYQNHIYPSERFCTWVKLWL